MFQLEKCERAKKQFVTFIYEPYLWLYDQIHENNMNKRVVRKYIAAYDRKHYNELNVHCNVSCSFMFISDKIHNKPREKTIQLSLVRVYLTLKEKLY